MNEDFLNDNVVIPEEILKMSPEERRAEICRLETEAAKEKERILKADSQTDGERNVTWALDTTDPDGLEAMERALDEKQKKLSNEKEKETDKKAV